jgi:hypothetical protein
MLFEDELRTAERVTLAEFQQRPAWKHSFEGLARTLSPML